MEKIKERRERVATDEFKGDKEKNIQSEKQMEEQELYWRLQGIPEVSAGVKTTPDLNAINKIVYKNQDDDMANQRV